MPQPNDPTSAWTNSHDAEAVPALDPLEAETLPPALLVDPAADPDATLAPATVSAPFATRGVPGYEILEELGRGGMGVVYKARQVGLNRLCALKMILAGQHATKSDLARFRTEAEAIARLNHANIVSVFDIGTHEGKPYFSLEYCDGGSLSNALNGKPLEPRAAAELVKALSEAMQAAHQANVIHRDLKPANILLASMPSSASSSRSRPPAPSARVAGFVPKITDFGLAKKLDEDSGNTQTGAVMGTPSYMAPEQAEGKKEVGPAADIYALGAILYYCLTGRPPFLAATPLDTILQVVSIDAAPVRNLNPQVSVDLETICHKCLRKDPAKRYVSAGALAQDLDRFLKGEPILARPIGRTERALKWMGRNRAVAALLTTVALLLLVGTVVSTYLALEARGQARLAEERKAQTEQLYYGAEMQLADLEWQAGQAGLTQQRLLEHAPKGKKHAFEWGYLMRLCHLNLRTMYGHTAWVRSVAMSSDGLLLASAGHDRTIKIWDAMTGKEVRTLVGHHRPVLAVAFSRNGQQLASSGEDQSVRVWDVASGREVHRFDGHKNVVTSVAFHPKQNILASASFDHTIKLWDMESGKEIRSLTGHTTQVISVAFDSQGERLASASFDDTVKVWDVKKGDVLLTLKGHTDGVNSAAFSPDGMRLASSGLDQVIRVWDLKTGKETQTLRGHTGPVMNARFSPDGQSIVSAGWDQTVRVWDLASGAARLLRGHTGYVSDAAFSPDGRRIASCGDVTVKLWDATHLEDVRSLPGHAGDIATVAYHPETDLLLSGGDGGTLKGWNLNTGGESFALAGHTGRVTSVAFSPDGRHAVSGSGQLYQRGRPGEVKVWDIKQRQVVRTLNGHTEMVTSVAWRKDNNRILSSGRDNIVRVWAAASGDELFQLPGYHAAFSSSGKVIASTGMDGSLALWDGDAGSNLRSWTAHAGPIMAVAFSPDDKLLATAGMDHTIKLWDPATGKEIRTLRGHGGMVLGIAFNPAGDRLASASADTTVKVWNPATGQAMLTLRHHSKLVLAVAFSADGNLLASGGEDSVLRVWDATLHPAEKLPDLLDRREARGLLAFHAARGVHGADLIEAIRKDGTISASVRAHALSLQELRRKKN